MCGAPGGKTCYVASRLSNEGLMIANDISKLRASILSSNIERFGLKNASVQHEDVMEIDFTNFDAFYLYNPFYENLAFHKRLNNEVELLGSLYGYYFKNTELKLSQTKKGTRLVTFHGNNFEVPESFKKVKEAEGGALKLWIKE